MYHDVHENKNAFKKFTSRLEEKPTNHFPVKFAYATSVLREGHRQQACYYRVNIGSPYHENFGRVFRDFKNLAMDVCNGFV